MLMSLLREIIEKNKRLTKKGGGVSYKLTLKSNPEGWQESSRVYHDASGDSMLEDIQGG